ncbi:patatin-like phospholipase family protein [Kineosporia babensis]|uniref:patatin-like phospholipase family protein n=1 Tax=Kineosporia babensis TaxID=499548 RepID=UPI0022AF8400|nr:patatin-like phospholipase family protein [Kineosporia babensis]
MTYSNLVFSGGGVKGVAYVGALQVLAEQNILSGIDAVAGTSAGAITASLVAAGYTPDEMQTLFMDLDFTTFEDPTSKPVGIEHLLEHYGWYTGDRFEKWMQTHLSGDPTFAELYRSTGKDLRIVTCDLVSRERVTLSHETYPNLKVSRGVRMSMSIALAFIPVTDSQLPGKLLVDGGTVWNYPLEMFDATDPSATLGFHLGLPDPAPGPAITSRTGFVEALYETEKRAQFDYLMATPADVKRTVFIDVLGISTLDFTITPEQKKELIASGAKATTAYLTPA